MSFNVAAGFSAFALISHSRDVAHDGPPISWKSCSSYTLSTRLRGGMLAAVMRPRPLGKISGKADKGFAGSGLLSFTDATSNAGAAVIWPWTCDAPETAVVV